jgi:polyribonucleotide nucleotidyltransferase
MHKIINVETNIGGKNLHMETGLMAHQANGAVSVRVGDTIVFATVVAAKSPREGVDFFPLQVEYREKFYAAGKFPGGFFKREARPSEREILTMRATDRPLRPLFPEGYRNEVQIISSLLSTDGNEEPDILSINGASAALMISDIPFRGPVGAVRVGRVNGEFVLNPTHTQIAESDLNLTYVGSRTLPLMIEGDAKEVSEADMIAAMKLAHEAVVKIVDMQLDMRKQLGLPDIAIEDVKISDELMAKAKATVGAELAEALCIAGKQERHDAVNAIREKLNASMQEQVPEITNEELFQLWDALEIELVRRNMLEHKKRIDGRAADELRPLNAQVGLLPRTHGSALFSRGETQALATVTLGTVKDAQAMDALSGGPTEKRFMLHYNFPPYCVGEPGRIGVTSRREIGHGNLAERSLKMVVPDDYPYTIRVVSEIMGSNGSSSMASVCAGCLALMDAGVPITKPVAGISVGLFSEGDKGELVVDILGAEDHCGDMDFKVSGTRDGITGFQVDLKIAGLPWHLVEGAFEMARKSRLQILDYMQTVLAESRSDIAAHAPRIKQLKIPVDKIGALIGPGGKNIRRITETYGVQIDIEDDGSVLVFSSDKDKMDAAVKEVEGLTAEAEEGKIYRGTVTGVKEFGAFVEILPGLEGLVHISELADFRVKQTTDICNVGDEIWVKCLSVEDNGRIRLSRRAAMAERGEETADA